MSHLARVQRRGCTTGLYALRNVPCANVSSASGGVWFPLFFMLSLNAFVESAASVAGPKAEHLGVCPNKINGNLWVDAQSTCERECNVDEDCADFEKCCTNVCGLSSCVAARFSDGPPPPPPPAGEPGWGGRGRQLRHLHRVPLQPAGGDLRPLGGPTRLQVPGPLREGAQLHLRLRRPHLLQPLLHGRRGLRPRRHAHRGGLPLLPGRTPHQPAAPGPHGPPHAHRLPGGRPAPNPLLQPGPPVHVRGGHSQLPLRRPGGSQARGDLGEAERAARPPGDAARPHVRQRGDHQHWPAGRLQRAGLGHGRVHLRGAQRGRGAAGRLPPVGRPQGGARLRRGPGDAHGPALLARRLPGRREPAGVQRRAPRGLVLRQRRRRRRRRLRGVHQQRLRGQQEPLRDVRRVPGVLPARGGGDLQPRRRAGAVQGLGGALGVEPAGQALPCLRLRRLPRQRQQLPEQEGVRGRLPPGAAAAVPGVPPEGEAGGQPVPERLRHRGPAVGADPGPGLGHRPLQPGGGAARRQDGPELLQHPAPGGDAGRDGLELPLPQHDGGGGGPLAGDGRGAGRHGRGPARQLREERLGAPAQEGPGGGQQEDLRGVGTPTGVARRGPGRGGSGVAAQRQRTPREGRLWRQSGSAGDLKVAGSIPGSSSLSVEVSLRETPHPDCS